MRTRLPESLPVMGTGLGNRGALLRAHPRVPLGVLYLPLRLLGLSRGSHGCQSSLPARDGSLGPCPPSRAGGHLRERSCGCAHACRGPLLCSTAHDSFSSPESGRQEWNERGGSLEKRHRLLSRRRGDPSQGAPRKFASPSPSSSLTAISNRCARSRAGRPGARRGRGRASRSALSSERAGVGGGRPALPEVA